MRRIALFCILGLAALSLQAAITTQDLTKMTPEQLGDLLAGPGITISNVKFTGANAAAGSFSGGSSGGLGIESGAILSSGAIANVIGPNTLTGASSSLGTAGDADLTALIPPFVTNDATILEFDFIAESQNFAIRYVFGSEEYKEFVGSPYNDVFGFFLNGQNIAFVAGSTSQLVTINSINHGSNSQFYVDNPTLAGPFDTQLDGFTTVLVASAFVTPGVTHHIKLAIADATDTALDSVVVLAEGGITGAPLLTLLASPYQTFAEIGQETSFEVQGFGFAPGVRYFLSAEGLPAGATITFSPEYLLLGESTTSTATIHLAGDSFPISYRVQLIATPDDPEVPVARGSALVTVGCAPPMILALDQPTAQVVSSGSSATLDVIGTGSGPFAYQWYEGPTGSLWFPIEGGVSASFTTPAVTRTRSFWVRISNACGTVDSASVRVSPASSRNGRGAGRPD